MARMILTGFVGTAPVENYTVVQTISSPLTVKMAGQTTLYNILFRNNYTMLGAVFAGAFAFQITWDLSTTRLWDNINKGRQWKDIKAKYVEGGEDEE
ncbi:hypothetical protein VPNG_00113 [Cytospora leucostoma]|uniref:Complex III subunit 9 n=1 Tax=Cytospora leucostoma TaxID=1230097 RepID=A0A423XNP7_9PEZI|nr:hypothetical protein VPNG_00113 [Cytospora leucostoma]